MKKTILILLLFLCGSNIFAQKPNEYYVSGTFAGKKISIIDKKNGYYINPQGVALVQQDENSNIFKASVMTSFDNTDNTKTDITFRLKDLLFRQQKADSSTFHQNITQKTYPFTDNNSNYDYVGADIGIMDTSTPENLTWTTAAVRLEKQNAGTFKITKVIRKNPAGDLNGHAIIEIEFDAILGRLKSNAAGEMKLITKPFKGKARIILQM